MPYWFLWGFLAVLLRFIPFVGSWMAALLPVVLSFAIAPGLVQPLLVLGVFIVLELLTANVAEPVLFGHSTGVSPVALLVAAAFWAWVWGPIGLVLSTPLTVCLVVLGQHVPRLKFLSLLLGDQPALAPDVNYYQRLLAGDALEAAQVAGEYAAAKGREHVPDEVFVPALSRARRDRENAGLDRRGRGVHLRHDRRSWASCPKRTRRPRRASNGGRGDGVIDASAATQRPVRKR